MAGEVDNVRQVAWQIFKQATILGPLIELAESAIRDSATASKSNDLEVLHQESRRQEFRARMAQAAARTQQEVAIARRIETALEVEIEEFYDTSGSGNLGLNVMDESIKFGASGEGRRVVRRVYRFKGMPPLPDAANTSEGSSEAPTE